MSVGNHYEGIKHVVQVDRHTRTSCEHCNQWLGGYENFAESINHYIEKHGYKLLHIGSDATYVEGGQYSNLIAILGK